MLHLLVEDEKKLNIGWTVSKNIIIRIHTRVASLPTDFNLCALHGTYTTRTTKLFACIIRVFAPLYFPDMLAALS